MAGRAARHRPPLGPGVRDRPRRGGRGAAADPRFYTVPAEREVQIRDLLTHTSGVASGTNSNFAARAAMRSARVALDELSTFVGRTGAVALTSSPGMLAVVDQHGAPGGGSQDAGRAPRR